MDEQEREKLIKEIRLNVLNDVQRALAKLMDDQMTQQQGEVRHTANIISYYIQQIASEVGEDKGGRIRL
ncbi:MAG: hypothetical protein WCF57_09395 [Pyrinomonadaceae bacterium]